MRHFGSHFIVVNLNPAITVILQKAACGFLHHFDYHKRHGGFVKIGCFVILLFVPFHQKSIANIPNMVLAQSPSPDQDIEGARKKNFTMSLTSPFVLSSLFPIKLVLFTSRRTIIIERKGVRRESIRFQSMNTVVKSAYGNNIEITRLARQVRTD